MQAPMKRNRMIGVGLSLGLAAGAFISIFRDDFAFWVGLGICLGVAGGAGWAKLSSRGNATFSSENGPANTAESASKAPRNPTSAPDD